jgi:hypothetical protein
MKIKKKIVKIKKNRIIKKNKKKRERIGKESGLSKSHAPI